MIYFDYNSTHPPFIDLLQKGIEAYGANFANPSGISYPSQKNQTLIEEARSRIARQLHTMHGLQASADQLLFVSTGTEAVHHLVDAFAVEGGTALLSPYEHAAMYEACRFAGMKVELLPGSSSGVVDVDAIRRRLQANDVSLLSVMAVCNETGVIQPLQDIAGIAKEFNVPFISDSIQAAGKIPLSLAGVDGMVLNGHKTGAGYGCAVVWINDKTLYRPIFRGGLQENERRAGTENLPAILTLPDAIDRQVAFHLGHDAATKDEDANGPVPRDCQDPRDHRDGRLRHDRHDRIETMLLEQCDALIAAASSKRNNTSYAIFPQMENMDFLLMALDREGILCSTGSSCRSRTRQPSQTLMRMGFSKDEALQPLRFSTGLFTTEDDVQRFLGVFPELYRRAL